MYQRWLNKIKLNDETLVLEPLEAIFHCRLPHEVHTTLLIPQIGKSKVLQ